MLPHRGYLCVCARTSAHCVASLHGDNRQQGENLDCQNVLFTLLRDVQFLECCLSPPVCVCVSVCAGVCVFLRQGFQQGVFKTCCSLSRWRGRGFAYIHSWAYWSFNGPCKRLNEEESGWKGDDGGEKQVEQNTGRRRRLRVWKQHICLACIRSFSKHSDKMAARRLFGCLLV